MKLSINHILFILCLLVLTACTKNEDTLDLIPADAQSVVYINTKSLVEKGKLNELEKQPIIANYLQEYLFNNNEEYWQSFKENPQQMGIDFNAPIYSFSLDRSGKKYFGILINLKKASDFQNFIEKILKSNDLSFQIEDWDNFKLINKLPVLIGWKSGHALILGSDSRIVEKDDAIFDEIIHAKPENSLKNNPQFSQFLKKTQDISIWSKGQLISTSFGQEYQKMMQQAGYDFNENLYNYHLTFAENEISFQYELLPNQALKDSLSVSPILKNKLNSDLFNYFPKNSYFHAGYSFNPELLIKLINTNVGKNYLETLKDNKLDLNDLIQKLDGECFISLYDIQVKTEKNTDSFSGISNGINLQYALILKTKDDNALKHLVDKLGQNVVNADGIYSVNLGHSNVYFSASNNYIFAASTIDPVQKFRSNGYGLESFKGNNLVNNGVNPSFGYLNLNTSNYPVNIENYIRNMLGIFATDHTISILNDLDHIEYQSQNDFKTKGKIVFKETKKNTFYTILNGFKPAKNQSNGN